jgi:hypothetical protein
MSDKAIELTNLKDIEDGKYDHYVDLGFSEFPLHNPAMRSALGLPDDGIGVLVTKPGVPASDVDLFAPKGFIDAGEAGIRSAGNLTLFATEIRNSANISVGGSATGVPTATVAPNLSLAAAGNANAAAAANSDQAAATDRDKLADENRQARSRLVVIEFLGFGEDGEEAFRRRKTSR